MHKTLHNNHGHIVAAYQDATILTHIHFANQKILPVISEANFLADYSLDYHFGFLTNNNDLQEGENTYCDTGELGSTLKDMLSGEMPPDNNICFLEKSGAIGKIVIIAYLKKNYHVGDYDDSVYHQDNFFVNLKERYFIDLDDYYNVKKKKNELYKSPLLSHINIHVNKFIFHFDSKQHNQKVDDILNVVYRDIAQDEKKLKNNESEILQHLILTV